MSTPILKEENIQGPYFNNINATGACTPHLQCPKLSGPEKRTRVSQNSHTGVRMGSEAIYGELPKRQSLPLC